MTGWRNAAILGGANSTMNIAEKSDSTRPSNIAPRVVTAVPYSSGHALRW